MTPRKRKEVDASTYSGRLALRLRMLRERSKLSVEDIAEKTGIPRTTIYNWEAGSNSPPYDALPILAEIYGVKVRTVIPEK